MTSTGKLAESVYSNKKPLAKLHGAGVSELSGALDSKSSALKACRFESGLRHLLTYKASQVLANLRFFFPVKYTDFKQIEVTIGELYLKCLRSSYIIYSGKKQLLAKGEG